MHIPSCIESELTEDTLELVAVGATVLATVLLLEHAVPVQAADGRAGDVLGLIDVAAVAGGLAQLYESAEDDALVVRPLAKRCVSLAFS